MKKNKVPFLLRLIHWLFPNLEVSERVYDLTTFNYTLRNTSLKKNNFFHAKNAMGIQRKAFAMHFLSDLCVNH